MTNLGTWFVLVVAACATPPKPADPQPESPWSEVADRMRCRVRAPSRAIQGELVRMNFEIQVTQAFMTPAGGVASGPDLRSSRATMALRDSSGRTVLVRTYDPDAGMPPDRDEVWLNLVRKNETRTEPIDFPLATAWDDLRPGDYRCRVTLECDAGRDGRFTRSLTAPEFPLRIDAAPPREETFLLPKALHVVETTFTTRDEGVETTIPVRQVVYSRSDAEEVRLPRRNGFFLGTNLLRDGQMFGSLGGATIEPDGANPIDASYGTGPESQKLGAAYTIVIFETADAPEHMWHPGPGSGGYRELWRRTIEVTPGR